MKTFAEIYESMKETQEYQVEELSLAFTESVLLRMEELNKLQGKDLAKRMRCSKAYVSKLLTGKGNFTFETLVKLGRALDCRIEPPHLIPNAPSAQVIRFARPPINQLLCGEFRAQAEPEPKEQPVQNDLDSNNPDAAAAA